jgi:hypothetical protein
MAQAIVVNGVYFTLNGKQYARTYVPLRVGSTNIAIYHIFDSRLQLLGTTPYTEFTVGGVGFASQELAMVGLNAALYANPADGLIGGGGSNLLFDTRIAPFSQVAAGGTAYANIGNMSLQNALLVDGQALHIKYGGTVDKSTGTPTIFVQGFSTNLVTGDLNIAGVGTAHDWNVDIDIMRISSSSMKWSGIFRIGDTNPQIFGGEKTALDFTVAHAVSITWTDAVALDEFELYYGYVNKLA